MKNKNETITLYTGQRQVVLDTLKNEGIYHVKKNYVKEKYREVSSIFLEAYSWLVKEMEKRVHKPEGAEYPVWVFTKKRDVEVPKGSELIILEVPVEHVLLFEQKHWNRVLNLSYLGESEEEEEEFQVELERQGITSQSDLFLTAFYPHLKDRVKKSWGNLFRSSLNRNASMQGALWEIRVEWIQNRDELGIE